MKNFCHLYEILSKLTVIRHRFVIKLLSIMTSQNICCECYECKKLRQMNIHKRYKWQAIFHCKTSKIFYKIKYQLDEMIQQITILFHYKKNHHDSNGQNNTNEIKSWKITKYQ